ncbi:DUF2325 domain-containing protein [Achromobacter aloeverae]
MAGVIAGLEAEVMRLRAAVMVKETALAWARDELDAVRAAVPGLPRRLALARRVVELEARVRELMRAQSPAYAGVTTEAGRTRGADTLVRRRTRQDSPAVETAAPCVPDLHEKVVLWISRDQATDWTERAIDKMGARVVQSDGSDASALDAGLADADLVVCQTGCVSHRAWWRVQDYCTRTGKQCVLVDRPDALRALFESSAHGSQTEALPEQAPGR